MEIGIKLLFAPEPVTELTDPEDERKSGQGITYFAKSYTERRK